MSASPAVAGSCSYGLVLSSTSDHGASFAAQTQRVERLAKAGILVDRAKTRLRKMKHGVMTAARLATETSVRGGFRFYPVLMTLTYRPGVTWRPKHLSELLKRCRHFCTKAGKPFRYVWVAEMQERGVVHYHVIVWMPDKFRLPKPDDRGWWPHGMSEIKGARAPAGYLAKYASKGQEPDAPQFPKGIRISGHGGVDEEARREFRWWRAPSEAREYLGTGADIRRVPGGRVDARDGAGLFWPSPWTLLKVNGKPTLVRKDELPSLVH